MQDRRMGDDTPREREGSFVITNNTQAKTSMTCILLLVAATTAVFIASMYAVVKTISAGHGCLDKADNMVELEPQGIEVVSFTGREEYYAVAGVVDLFNCSEKYCVGEETGVEIPRSIVPQKGNNTLWTVGGDNRQLSGGCAAGSFVGSGSYCDVGTAYYSNGRTRNLICSPKHRRWVQQKCNVEIRTLIGWGEGYTAVTLGPVAASSMTPGRTATLTARIGWGETIRMTSGVSTGGTTSVSTQSVGKCATDYPSGVNWAVVVSHHETKSGFYDCTCDAARLGCSGTTSHKDSPWVQ